MKAIIIGVGVVGLVWVAANWQFLYAEFQERIGYEEDVIDEGKHLEDDDRPIELMREEREFQERNKNRRKRWRSGLPR